MDASQDIAACEAAKCRLEAVPVSRLMDDFCDAPSWLFSEERHKAGLDPWTEIQGVDCTLDETAYWVDVPGGAYVVMRPDDRVFVQTKDFQKLST